MGTQENKSEVTKRKSSVQEASFPDLCTEDIFYIIST